MRTNRTTPPWHLCAWLLATGLLAAACGSRSGSGGLGYVEGDGVVDEYPVAERPSGPAFAGDTLAGSRFDTAEHRGEILVINVWGSWCAPCRAEAPVLRRVWEESRSHHVQFVGIDVKDNDAAARAFEDSFRITYPSITTTDAGPALLAFGAVAPRNAIPSTIVVGRDGKVTARIIGRSTYYTLHDLVQSALAEGGPVRTP